MVSKSIVPLDNGDVDYKRPYAGGLPNLAPVLDSPIPDFSWNVGSPVSYDVSQHFSDPDGDPLTYSADVLPAGVDLVDGVLTGSPTEVYAGPTVITATDPGLLFVSDTTQITVDPAPDVGEWPLNPSNPTWYGSVSTWEKSFTVEPYRSVMDRVDLAVMQGWPQYGRTNRIRMHDIIGPWRDANPSTKLMNYWRTSEFPVSQPAGTWDINERPYRKIILGDGDDFLARKAKDPEVTSPGRELKSFWGIGNKGEQFKVNEVGAGSTPDYPTWAASWVVEAFKDLDNGGDGSYSIVEGRFGRLPLTNGIFHDIGSEVPEKTADTALEGTIQTVHGSRDFTINWTRLGTDAEQNLIDDLAANQSRQLNLRQALGGTWDTVRIDTYDDVANRITVQSDYKFSPAVGQRVIISLGNQTYSIDYLNNGVNQSISNGNSSGSVLYRDAWLSMHDQIDTALGADFCSRCINAGTWGIKANNGSQPDYPSSWANKWEYPWQEFTNDHIGFNAKSNGTYVFDYFRPETAARYYNYNRYLTRVDDPASSTWGFPGLLYHAWGYFNPLDKYGEFRPLDAAYFRSHFCWARMFEANFYNVGISYVQVAGWIDEMSVDFGNWYRDRNILEGNDQSVGYWSGTMRDYDAPNEVWWEEADNGIVIFRAGTIATGTVFNPTHLGGGGAVTVTPPDPGVGKKWQRIDAVNYVHPTTGKGTIPAFRDEAFNNGADVATVPLGKGEGIALLRVDA